SEPTLSAAVNEVQEVAISATKGDFVLGSFELSHVLPYNATHQQVQEVLEGIYGAGAVEVPEGEGDEAGDKPYVIKFVGPLEGQHVGMVEAQSFPFPFGSYSELTGGIHGPKADAVDERETTVGHPAERRVFVTVTNLGDADANGETNPIKIVTKLPAGLTAAGIEATSGGSNTINSRGPVSCSSVSLVCTFSGSLPPYDQIEISIGVEVLGGAGSESVE